MNNQLIEFLSAYVSNSRKELFLEALSQRTRHLAVVVEDIFQPHNASAVLRTCDCFGVQDVHIVENTNTYKVNPGVAKGASKWLSLHTYNEKEWNSTDCIKTLRQKGYKIVATSPRTEGFTPTTLPIHDPVALCYGTELTGLSQEFLDEADYHIRIPMYGFTESFNISVSAAICLSHITERMRIEGVNWQLSDEDRQHIHLEWLRTTVARSEILERDYLIRILQNK